MTEDTPDDDSTTTSTRERWEYIGTVLATVVLVSLPVLILAVAMGVMTLSGITQGWYVLYSTVVLMAATWAFGKEALDAVSEFRGK